MGKEIISEKEGISIFIFFLTGATLVFPTGAAAGKDLWIAILISILFSLIISLVYIKILVSYPGKDLFEILELLFGKIIGKMISLLYVWFAFHLASLTFYDFYSFIKTVTFPETQIYLAVIFPIIIVIWGVKIGIEGIGRFSNITIIPVFLFMFLSLSLLIPKMNFDRFLPLLEHGFKPVIKGTFMVFTFPLAESVVLLGVLNNFKEKKSIPKVYIFGTLIAGSILLLSKITDIAVLGFNTFSEYYFPLYATVSRIQLGDFIQRIEIIAGIIFIFGALIKASMCMLIVCKGLTRILSFDDYRFLVTPMVLLCVAFAFIVNPTIFFIVAFDNLAWRYYAFPFQVIIPVLILIFIYFKKKTISP